MRPSGVSSASAAKSSSDSSAFMGVRMTPGVTQLTRMPLGPTSFAVAFVSPITPAFAAEYAASQLAPTSPHMLLTLTIAPCPREIIPGTKAGERDFDTEFLDYILAVGVVDSLDAAIAHVQAHSTHHSDAIVTENEAAAERFLDEIDSAAVYVNASTRFTDGGEFGLGCEMGISTQKLHARGPMGLDALSTYKYIIRGHGQIR